MAMRYARGKWKRAMAMVMVIIRRNALYSIDTLG